MIDSLAKIIKIAVIDDDKNLRKLVNTILERVVSAAIIAFDPMFELIDIIKENKFDLIILDYLMPKIDGLEILINLANENVNTPVILFTAYPEIEQVQVLKDHGLNMNIKILKKPFEIENFIKLVKTTLQEHRQQE